MFELLGRTVTRGWWIILIAWVALLVTARSYAPAWTAVSESRELAFLPSDSPTLEAQRLFQRAFPENLAASNVVIIAHRAGNEELGKADRKFLSQILKPALLQIAEDEGGLVSDPGNRQRTPGADANAAHGDHEPIISRVWTIDERLSGKLLRSEDRQAALVMVQLVTEFLEKRNGKTIGKIEQLLTDLQSTGRVPAGLELSLGGSAVLGRDTLQATIGSAKSTENWTIALVIILLLLIYRAPLLALIPLLTVFVAVDVALKALAILAQAGYIHLFEGLRSYITVIAYGAGVDFALFLTARYKEELDAGLTPRESVGNAVTKVGGAVAASAGTQIGGIAMMYFADFGKFRLAGIGIPFALMVVLCASLTFSPALLRLAGRWAFWPNLPGRPRQPARGWPRFWQRILPRDLTQGLWDFIGQMLAHRPGTVWLVGFGAMLPFAVLAVAFLGFLSYGLVSELSDDAPSVVGTNALREHFPAGASGPITVLVVSPDVDFRDTRQLQALEEWTERLRLERARLRIADIRNAAHPLGISGQAIPTLDDPLGRQILYLLMQNLGDKIIRRMASGFYVSDEADLDGHVTQMHFVLEMNPFTREAIKHLDTLEEAIRDTLPEEFRSRSQLHFLGATASLRDLKSVAESDRVRINTLVVGAVFVILMALLRKAGLSLYLIASVVYSYFTTLGVTLAVFVLLGGDDFPGLYWTVPTFLFTVLVAVGADYNIFLVARIEEESERHPPLEAIQVALTKTGRIISSCGIIMAGTFSSLMFGGELAGMVQLGFALSFGVLLDTFVVRPVLVPAFLIMAEQGRLGWFGRQLRRTPQEAQLRLHFEDEQPAA